MVLVVPSWSAGRGGGQEHHQVVAVRMPALLEPGRMSGSMARTGRCRARAGSQYVPSWRSRRPTSPRTAMRPRAKPPPSCHGELSTCGSWWCTPMHSRANARWSRPPAARARHGPRKDRHNAPADRLPARRTPPAGTALRRPRSRGAPLVPGSARRTDRARYRVRGRCGGLWAAVPCPADRNGARGRIHARPPDWPACSRAPG